MINIFEFSWQMQETVFMCSAIHFTDDSINQNYEGFCILRIYFQHYPNLNSKPYPSDSLKGRDVGYRNYFWRGSVPWCEW